MFDGHLFISLCAIFYLKIEAAYSPETQVPSYRTTHQLYLRR